MNTSPIYTHDPDLEAVADRFKERLLGLGDRVVALRAIRNMTTDHDVETRAGISEEYAEKARLDHLARLVYLEPGSKVPITA